MVKSTFPCPWQNVILPPRAILTSTHSKGSILIVNSSSINRYCIKFLQGTYCGRLWGMSIFASTEKSMKITCPKFWQGDIIFPYQNSSTGRPTHCQQTLYTSFWWLLVYCVGLRETSSIHVCFGYKAGHCKAGKCVHHCQGPTHYYTVNHSLFSSSLIELYYSILVIPHSMVFSCGMPVRADGNFLIRKFSYPDLSMGIS